MDEDEVWVALVDEPIGDVVARIHDTDAEIAALVASPRHQLAFRTFAYIRVGLLLGQLLVDHDVAPAAPEAWVDDLLGVPEHYRAVVDEVRAVASEVAADPRLADTEGGRIPMRAGGSSASSAIRGSSRRPRRSYGSS